MSFQIIRNDITKVAADAIVNTANPLPTYGSGTDQAIYEAAGKDQLLAARKIIGEIAPGEAFETKAFNLEAKYIIHTVGPAWMLVRLLKSFSLHQKQEMDIQIKKILLRKCLNS